MATEDEIQISNKKLYIIGGIVLILIFGFILGKIYTVWTFSQDYVFFSKDDVREMCARCRYKHDFDFNQTFQRGENETIEAGIQIQVNTS
jgi:hypothetical protein